MSISSRACRLTFLATHFIVLSTIGLAQELRSGRRPTPPFAPGVETSRLPSGRPAEMADYERMVRDNPTDAVSLNNLGTLYFGANRYDEAIAVFEKAIALAPTIAGMHLNLSIVYEKLGRYSDALPPSQKAVDGEPDLIIAREQLCGLLFRLEKNREAAACYAELIKMPAPASLAKLHYAAALIKAGQNQAGLTVLEDLTAAEPENAAAHNALGVTRHRQKQYKSAVAALKRAVEINPDRSSFRYNLAIAQFSNRNKIGAISQYNLLRDSDPKLAREIYKIIYADKLVFVPK